MIEIINLMLNSIKEIRESGSYFLFYLLALGLGLAISWDRYSQTETQDNWMLEEAKEKIHLWPFLYGLMILVLVVANPLVIWFLNKIIPMESGYHRVWLLMPVIFLSAYGVVCFLSLLREEKQKVVLLAGFIFLIGLAGNFYGYMSERKGKEAWEEERQVIALLEGQTGEEEIKMLAADAIIEYAGNHCPRIAPVYGKDLYTPGMDLGIMDSYDSSLLELYEAMKNPKDSLELIAQEAAVYDCDFIVLKEFENPPGEMGNFTFVQKLGQYLIYHRLKSGT